MGKRFGFTLAAALAVALALPALADVNGRVTFYKDVLPILQENCQTCHRTAGANMSGMIAPMALTSYAEVRPWAKAIARQVEARNMPPWHASKEFHGVFAGERTLSEDEIATITNWADQGGAAGNAADAPAPVQWQDSGWYFGAPDMIVKLPEPYLVKDEITDEYVDIPVTITKEMLPEPRWVRAAEIHAGCEAVHHVIARPLAGNAPGVQPKSLPEGYGSYLEPGTTVNFEMHYHKEAGAGTAVWDQTEIGVWFHTKPVYHEVASTAIGNTSFQIPPHAGNWRVGSSRVFEKDTLLLTMMPHMHLRGKAAKYTAFWPDGTTEVILDVPRYDFNWQTVYEYPEPRLIPAGTRIDCEMYFDNSEANPSNPDANASVVFDGPTTAEMMLGWISICDAEAKPDKILEAKLGKVDESKRTD